MTVGSGVKLLQAGILLVLLGLALYAPYLWFGVVPFASDYSLSPEQLQRLLAGRNIPDYYASEPPPISEQALAAERQAFTWCRFCHTVEAGGENRVGPNLHRIFGKPAASVAGFPYSDAFLQAQQQGLIWTPETMAAFIADPAAMVPGNRMRYPPHLGYEKSPERDRQIIDYLLRKSR